MYQFKSRVRYSEVDSEQNLTLPALLDYLQDCCTFQSEDMNVGVDFLAEQKAAWVLSSWEIVINRLPKLAEEIEVGTWPCDFKGFYGYRNFVIKDKQGEILAFANSVWVFMNTEQMRPARIPKNIAAIYQPMMEPQISHEWSERKIRAAESVQAEDPVAVQRFHIDTNHHMNNSKYVLIAEEYLPEDFHLTGIRVEYRKAAVLGDRLYPQVAAGNDDVTVTLADEDGKPYAVVQFK